MIVFGKQDGEALSRIHLGTAFGLGRHGVESEHPSFDESRRQKRFESTDFMLLVLDVDLEKDNACGHIVGAELMPWVSFFARCPYGFAIESSLCMLQIPHLGLQAAWLISTTLLRFPSRKEGGEQIRTHLSSKTLQHPLVRHLARHRCALSLKRGCQRFSSQTSPLGGSFQSGLTCHLGQTKQAKQDR
ncbi:MAG: hypothetical protein ACRDHZ_12410 [Ktedonobacteraceae bacterium]